MDLSQDGVVVALLVPISARYGTETNGALYGEISIPISSATYTPISVPMFSLSAQVSFGAVCD
jgi:hypothetical protein